MYEANIKLTQSINFSYAPMLRVKGNLNTFKGGNSAQIVFPLFWKREQIFPYV